METGAETITDGRLKAVRDHLPDGEPFCLTYNDGGADIDIGALIAFHQANSSKATVTSVAPLGRFAARWE